MKQKHLFAHSCKFFRFANPLYAYRPHARLGCRMFHMPDLHSLNLQIKLKKNSKHGKSTKIYSKLNKIKAFYLLRLFFWIPVDLYIYIRFMYSTHQKAKILDNSTINLFCNHHMLMTAIFLLTNGFKRYFLSFYSVNFLTFWQTVFVWKITKNHC